jgi:opacity protein-like surface antigen
MSKHSLKYIFILFLLLLLKPAHAQTEESDVIITKKGERISCAITKQDSAKIYFKIGGNMSNIEANILLSEISEIQYGKKKQSQLPTLGQAPGTEQKDDYVPINTPTVNSQTKKMELPKKENSITIFAGGAWPVGNFNRTELDTNEIGPGKAGAAAGINFTHLSKNGLIFGLNAFLSNNELNTGPITNKYLYHSDSVWTADKANWRAFGIHLSIGYHKVFSEDLMVYAKINAGYISLKYPEVTLRVSSSQYLKFNSSTADAISYGAAAGINYRLFESLGASLEISYLQANCKFNEIIVIGEAPATPINKKITQTKRDVKQSYQNVFVTAGVNYWF